MGWVKMLALPDYLDGTLVDRRNGFFLQGPVPRGISDPSHLSDTNYWVVLACALERCKSGDFQVFPSLLRALRTTDDGLYWNCCGVLFSFAAPYTEIAHMGSLFQQSGLHTSPELTRLYCEILANSMGPMWVLEILSQYRACRDEDVRVSVAMYLSHMLEQEPEQVARGPLRKLSDEFPPPFETYYLDYDGYLSMVETRLANLVADAGGDRIPLHGGAVFSVCQLARRIQEHASAGEDSSRTNVERLAFEAATGVRCTSFFGPSPENNYKPLSATAIVEDFLQSPDAARYKPGVRYFFGRPIPP